MTAAELISTIKQRGGAISLDLDGENLRVRLPRDEAERLKPKLRAVKPEIVALLREGSVVYLDIPCTCSEKPYPHFRHGDGTGPGSGRTLEPGNPKQAHGRRR